MNNINRLKQFVFNNLLIENTFEQLEREGISVRGGKKAELVSRIEPADFSPKVRHEAVKMASVYEAFYCLENAVRDLIVDRLVERKGLNWWVDCISDPVKKHVKKLQDEEAKNKYHTRRSSSPIGYTTFGHLEKIIVNNWEDFSDLFPDQAWISARFSDLEKSRNIIMHSGVLPEIEIDRIQSIVRDWVRQVG